MSVPPRYSENNVLLEQTALIQPTKLCNLISIFYFNHYYWFVIDFNTQKILSYLLALALDRKVKHQM